MLSLRESRRPFGDVERICGTALDLRHNQDDKGRTAKRIVEKVEPSRKAAAAAVAAAAAAK